MKRPNPVTNESEIPILLYKRARPVPSFFSDLAQENPNELCNQNDCSITTQSTKSTQTVSGDTTVTVKLLNHQVVKPLRVNLPVVKLQNQKLVKVLMAGWDQSWRK